MESGKRRFVDTSDEEIEQKRLKMSADKTIKQNIAAATIFREYLKVKKMDPGFEQYDTLKLDEVLGHFYMDVSKADGNRYKTNSLQCLRYSLNRYLKAPSYNKKIDIVNNESFSASRENFKAAMAELKRMGLGDVEHYPCIDEADRRKIVCDKLWQRPKDQFWEEEPSWYYNIPVGEKTLGNFMLYLSKKFNLSEIYTNHSIRATGATVLAKNSYCNAQIIAVTGHKSVASLSLYQRVDNDDKIRMGQTLTESITEPSKALALTAGETSSNIRALPSSSCTVPPKTLAIAPSTFLPLPNITTASTTLMMSTET
ncbi:Hypothetical predicted protein [Mytilus galloprovincialis]|uniref:KCTD1_15 n=1 Tax=Mytilus galloprovincialis TaxID=29158 RepID=A0A8B6H4F6_MYTGA|nr:Hypothetical predicted protein [Mytilus galloprovincialis]